MPADGMTAARSPRWRRFSPIEGSLRKTARSRSGENGHRHVARARDIDRNSHHPGFKPLRTAAESERWRGPPGDGIHPYDIGPPPTIGGLADLHLPVAGCVKHWHGDGTGRVVDIPSAFCLVCRHRSKIEDYL